ncbi:Ger(x)C family spore germination protein [Bacillus zhangzhouensis]
MDIGKTNVIMVGKELAQKKGIIPLIEPIFRSQSGYLASKLIITNGNGEDILSIQNEVNPIVFEILKLVENGEKQTFIPQTNTFEI